MIELISSEEKISLLSKILGSWIKREELLAVFSLSSNSLYLCAKSYKHLDHEFYVYKGNLQACISNTSLILGTNTDENYTSTEKEFLDLIFSVGEDWIILKAINVDTLELMFFETIKGTGMYD